MEETVSGVKFQGRWKKMVEKARQVTEALEESAEQKDIEAWDNWRPSEEEDLDREVKERTVEEAALDESELEKDVESVAEETGDAVKVAGSAVSKVAGGNIEEASEKSQEAASGFFRSLGVSVRKFLRKTEHIIYRHIIARANPQYFDSELVSASLHERNHFQRRKDTEDREYVMAVNINDDTVSEEFQEKMREREGR